MSRIDDMIVERCPNGVPHRRLGDVGQFIRGRRFTKADRVDAGLPSIHYGEIYTHYGVSATEALTHVDPALARSLRFARPGDVIFAAVGETVADVGKAVAWLGETDVAVHDDCFIFRSDLDPRFVVYFSQSAAFNRPKEPLVARAKVKRLSGESLASLRIPVPPLDVQREMVRVLDRFTALEAELGAQLKAELEARSRWDAFFRGQALALSGLGARTAAMGDVLSMRAGVFVAAADIAPTKTVERPYRCYGGNGLRGYVATSTHDGDFVLVGRQGALSGNTKRVTGRFHATEHAVVVTPIAAIDTSWLFHQLTQMNLNQYASQGAQPGLAVATLNRILMPVPDVDDQSRTGATLDKFDSLVNDLSIALNAELAARRMQHAHYRDKLLTFPEAV